MELIRFFKGHMVSHMFYNLVSMAHKLFTAIFDICMHVIETLTAETIFIQTCVTVLHVGTLITFCLFPLITSHWVLCNTQ